MLVRSTSKGWSTNSLLSVDSGCLLAALARIIEDHAGSDSQRPLTLTTGPFQGLTLPHINKNANALHIAKELIQTFIVTHPHLDHISGFIFATAGMDFKRQKKLAALPSTLHAFRHYIFNGIIWPNLSDQHSGVKLVSYYELTEGGEPTIEDGGYVTLAEGLDVMAMRVTHGNCRLQHFKHTMKHNAEMGYSYPVSTPVAPNEARTPETPSAGESSAYKTVFNAPVKGTDDQCPVDSTAVFIRDAASKQEILIFGDVEPDTISLRPLNKLVWLKAAPKIASGQLKAIFIESSWTDSKPDDYLFGHLTPKYIFEELRVLAGFVESLLSSDYQNDPKKRKRTTNTGRRQSRTSKVQESPTSQRRKTPITQTSDHLHQLSVEEDIEMTSPAYDGGPLSGVKVVIIHVKDQMVDGPDPRVTIREELKAHEERERLGAQFIVSESGDSYYI